MPPLAIESVAIFTVFLPRWQPPFANGPRTGTRKLVGVVQRSASVDGGSIVFVMRLWSAWNSGSKRGSPLSSACWTVTDCTPFNVQRDSAVLLAHTATANWQMPLTVPSRSHGSHIGWIG